MGEPSGEEKSFYAVLNVPPDASDDLIRRAYRQLATTYHPDKHADPEMQQEAARMFTLVQEAYEVGGRAAAGGGCREHRCQPRRCALPSARERELPLAPCKQYAFAAGVGLRPAADAGRDVALLHRC